jgi:hypothetical protein
METIDKRFKHNIKKTEAETEEDEAETRAPECTETKNTATVKLSLVPVGSKHWIVPDLTGVL